MSLIPRSKKSKFTCLTWAFALSFLLALGACTPKPQPLQVVTPPSANLMVKAPPLYRLSDPENVDPNELLAVDIKNAGLYRLVAERLHLLQEWAKQQFTER